MSNMGTNRRALCATLFRSSPLGLDGIDFGSGKIEFKRSPENFLWIAAIVDGLAN